MIQTALEVTSSLLFPKICQTCDELLPWTDRLGVCKKCHSALLKIWPPFCIVCGRGSAAEGQRCGQCQDQQPSYQRAYSALLYEGKTRELLQQFKYKNQRSLGHFFSQTLLDFIDQHLDTSGIDCLVGVPMEALQQRERGFNQSTLLSKAVAKQIQKPDFSHFLTKKLSKQHQSLLNKRERLANIEGSFRVQANHPFLGKHILLVDDILTTGFTASECAKTLHTAGAITVTVLTVARGL